jgi:hypothetical protein
MGVDPEACIQGGVFICEDEELPRDVDEDNVCTQDECFLSETLESRCEDFLVDCLTGAANMDEKCIAGALFICNVNI